MSENEFEVIDNLYFVTSFADLKALSGLNESLLIATLGYLIEKEWVKCLLDPDNEVPAGKEELRVNYNKYQYLATKRGLLAHNIR